MSTCSAWFILRRCTDQSPARVKREGQGLNIKPPSNSVRPSLPVCLTMSGASRPGDGTLDAVIADWDFNPQTARSISLDARYMLWQMTVVDKADRLLKEMGAL